MYSYLNNVKVVVAVSHSSLQEVVWSPLGGLHLRPSPGCRVELYEGPVRVVSQLEDGGHVPAPVAVVGGREDGDQVPLVGPAVALHRHLVRPADHGQPVAEVEGPGDVLPEGVSRPPGRHPPALPPLLRVGPEQVGHGTLVRRLLQPVQRPDLVQGGHAGPESVPASS